MKRNFFLALVLLSGLAAGATAQNFGGSCPTNVIPSAAGHQFGYPSYLGCGGFCFNFLGRMHQHGPLVNYGPYEGYYPFAPYGPWDSNFAYSGPGGGCGHGGHGANSHCGWNSALFHRGGRLGGLLGGHGGGHGRNDCGAGGCGTGAGLFHGGGLGGGFLGGHGTGCGAGGCRGGVFGDYAMTTMRGVFHRSHPLCHKAKISTGCSVAPASGCGDCAGTASAPATSVVHPVSATADDSAPTPVRAYRER